MTERWRERERDTEGQREMEGGRERGEREREGDRKRERERERERERDSACFKIVPFNLGLALGHIPSPSTIPPSSQDVQHVT